MAFTDPFGLCLDARDPRCGDGGRAWGAFKRSVARWIDNTVDLAYRAAKALPGLIAREMAEDALVASVPVVGGYVKGRRVAAVSQSVGRFLSESSHLRLLATGNRVRDDAHDFARIGASADEVVDAVKRGSGWETVQEMVTGTVKVGKHDIGYSLKPLTTGEVVVNAWIK